MGHYNTKLMSFKSIMGGEDVIVVYMGGGERGVPRPEEVTSS